jgi:hypothetical protein
MNSETSYIGPHVWNSPRINWHKRVESIENILHRNLAIEDFTGKKPTNIRPSIIPLF